MNLRKFDTYSTVKVCKSNVCIEAKGENGRMLVIAACIALLLMGIAALANAIK